MQNKIKKPPTVYTAFRAWEDVRERAEQEVEATGANLSEVLNYYLNKSLPKKKSK